jgi:predicted nuclease of restriction endonuclease-like (RecB) superfamily
MNRGLGGVEYAKFLIDIKSKIRQAQYDALRVVNKGTIGLYWDIGKDIIQKQKELGWGKSVVRKLSEDLQKEFPGVPGFSVQNIWYMRQFYSEYHNNPKLQPLVGEISWTKHLVIMAACKSDDERLFYIEMTRKFGWTKNVLIHQVETDAYKRHINGQTNFDKALPDNIKSQAKLAVKDEYMFGFAELGEGYAESELEHGLMNNMRKFLLEMGGDFCFIGNQYRLEVEGDEFFVDLLLFHRQLRCLVAIELKVGKFIPEHAGKMNFYLSVLNDKKRLEHENPPIGIIICKDKNRTVVEYAMKDMSKPIGVATYNIQTKLPKAMRRYLPTPDAFAKGLEALENKRPNRNTKENSDASR